MRNIFPERKQYVNYQQTNNIVISIKKRYVNKMLKTVKEMFTITFRPSGAGGALYSKFEAPN